MLPLEQDSIDACLELKFEHKTVIKMRLAQMPVSNRVDEETANLEQRIFVKSMHFAKI